MAESPLLQIPQVSPNQNNKETTINDGFVILERSLNDVKNISMAAGNVEVNIVDYTRAFLFQLTGAAVPRQLTLPASKRFFGVYNTGTSPVTVKVKDSAGVTAVINPASYVILFNTGVDARIISDSAASGQVSAFLSLPDTPSSFAGQAGKALVVNPNEDGMTFGTISVSFLALTDTPANYTGHGSKLVRVNAAGTGLEFTTHLNTFAKLTDTPADYVSQAGRMVVVRADEKGVEFQDVPEPIIKATRILDVPNGGFELGDMTNWIVPSTSGSVWAVDFGYAGIEAQEGSYIAYHAAGQGNEPTVIAYDLDLLSMAYAEEIDGEADIVVDIGMASPFSDFGAIEVEFFDEFDVSISAASSPEYIGTMEMIDRRFRVAIPEFSRTVRVYLHARKNDQGEDPAELAFVFDDLRVELKITVDHINSFVQLFDTPLSYENQAGKKLVVNATEDALEFADDVAVKENFTSLNDVPSAYTANALKFLRVKNDMSGLEFFTASILHLSGFPSAFTGHSKKAVRVNAAENSLEFYSPVLSDLSNVVPTGAVEGDVLIYDAASQKWLPGPQEASSGGSLASLVDVNVSTPPPTNGQVLVFHAGSGKWVPGAAASGGTSEIAISTKSESYVLVLADAGKYIRMDTGLANTVTVPLSITVTFPIGTQIVIRQASVGQTTLVGAPGVTLISAETLKLRKMGSTATLIKITANTWDVTGDLELSA